MIEFRDEVTASAGPADKWWGRRGMVEELRRPLARLLLNRSLASQVQPHSAL
jgi:hypothetical protein